MGALYWSGAATLPVLAVILFDHKNNRGDRILTCTHIGFALGVGLLALGVGLRPRRSALIGGVREDQERFAALRGPVVSAAAGAGVRRWRGAYASS